MCIQVLYCIVLHCMVQVMVMSKGITQHKHHFKFVFEGEYRKFTVKLYGADEALCACEAFKTSVYRILGTFDQYTKKAKDRRDFLEEIGCSEINTIKKIQDQRRALIRRLCNGKVQRAEEETLKKLLKDVAGDMDVSCFKLQLQNNSFSASFQGAKHNVEKSFGSFVSAFVWLKSMSIADKAGGCSILFLCSVLVQLQVYSSSVMTNYEQSHTIHH